MLALVNDPKIVILHCADSPDYAPDHASFDAIGSTEITAWHIARGFETIGYHWVVRRSGVIESGRPETTIGAHCQGYNTDSLGICWVGKIRPTEAQLNALEALYRAVKNKYGIDHESWFGHYEFNPGKTCPGFSMLLFRAWLKGLK